MTIDSTLVVGTEAVTGPYTSRLTLNHDAGESELRSWGPDSFTRGSFTLSGMAANGTLGLDYVTITNTGNIGLGTSSPSSLLHVQQPTLSAFTDLARFSVGDSGRTYSIGLGNGSGSTDFSIRDNLAATTRMVITGTGNVGIGTSSPGIGASADTRYLTISSTTGTNPIAELQLQGSRNNTNNTNARISGWEDTTELGRIQFTTGTRPGSDSSISFLAYNSSGNPIVPMVLDGSGAVTLGPTSGTAVSHTVQGNGTSGTLRVKAGSFSGHIALERDTTSVGTVWLGTANGDFRIGSTAGGTDIGQATAAGAWTLGPSSGLDGSHLIRSNRTAAGHNVSSFWAQHNTLSASLTSGIVDIGFTTATPSSTSQTYIRFFNNGDADIGGVRHATANSVSYQTSSDLRKKENIQVLENALDVINSVSAKRFTWKLDKVNDVGFIAQEMLEVTPNAVGGSDEGTYSMDYSRVTPYLWNAVRELHALVETQATELQSAKDRIAQLEGTP